MPDEVLVGLVVEAIVRLRDEPVEAAEGKPAPKGKPAAGKAGSAEENANAALLPGPRGFVLDGFPRTVAQARLLEKALVGLDLEWREALKKKASVLAPPPPDPVDDMPLVSGLDKLLAFELPVDTAEEVRASCVTLSARWVTWRASQPRAPLR